jgi:phospholipid/cholesterol/gamma-HCH transport system permease protein
MSPEIAAPLPGADAAASSERAALEVAGDSVRLSGDMTLTRGAELWKELRRLVAGITRGKTVNFDMKGVAAIDGGALSLLVAVRAELRLRGVQCEFVEATPGVHELLHLYQGDVDGAPVEKQSPAGALERIGLGVVSLSEELGAALAFFGTAILAVIGVLRKPRTANWKALAPIMERAGVDALPIVLLINFLVGFVMAYQGSIELKRFGANIYIADLVDLSMARELGPLMTAIVVCGRSGAAFAAELGTMQVSEEIDALETLGLSPIAHLVLPRVFGLVLVLPFLTLFADMVGMIGGIVVSVLSLNVTVRGYLVESKTTMTFGDIGSGLVKSMLFAVTIAVISCQQGFATTGGAEGVGRRTTASVVSILFALILIDAAFVVLLHVFHP